MDEAVAAFKQEHGLHHVIAFSGGASTELAGVPKDDSLQHQFAAVQAERELRLVRGVLNVLRHYRVAILTGGTRFGFPKAAIEIAKEMHLKTIGVFPMLAFDKGHVVEEQDLPICVHPQFGESAWGDESPVFCKLFDAAVVFGGGAGTLIEVAHVLKMNEALLKAGKKVKVVIPAHGSGGVADGMHFVWGKQEIKFACLPEKPVLTGEEAARHIELHLDLFSVEQ